jgi:hypothetical protein
MATEVAEVLCCRGAYPHRIVWRGNEPELLDHDGETGLDETVTCVGRVLAWWRTGVHVVSDVAGTGGDDHDDALWAATCLDPEVISALRIHGTGPAEVLRARAVGMPVRADGTIDDRGADPTSWQPLLWLVASRPPDCWRCPSCAIELPFDAAWSHWEERGDCYWRRGRAEREGWLRTTFDVAHWSPTTRTIARTHLRPERHGPPTPFVRSAAEGLTSREIVGAIEVLLRREPHLTDAAAADVLARLHRLEIVRLVSSPPTVATVTTDHVSGEQP